MEAAQVVELGRDALWLAVLLGAPLLTGARFRAAGEGTVVAEIVCVGAIEHDFDGRILR